MEFNEASPLNLHLDLNSCFASIEQQANPFLRGKPVVVVSYPTRGGCILASSVEAKRLGIKTGMRVFEGQEKYSKLVVLKPDPWKYRNVHLKLKKILLEYTDDLSPKSIDEFVLNLKDYLLTYRTRSCTVVAQELKNRIKKEIGDWLTVSVGIAPNRYLAKVAAGLHKPDGLDEINKNNFLDIYTNLKLTDLTGIKSKNAVRLNAFGIYSVLDFYQSPIWKLKSAFHSITGLYWHMRLSGYEIDNVEFCRKSFGNSVALGKDISKMEDLSPILARLTEKVCSRLRGTGYQASGVHLALVYKNGTSWHKGRKLSESRFDTRDIYKAVFRLLMEANPISPVLNIAVSLFDLTRFGTLQMGLFEDRDKKERLVRSEDLINKRWGDFTIGSVRSFSGAKVVLDRIAFGGVKELEERILDT